MPSGHLDCDRLDQRYARHDVNKSEKRQAASSGEARLHAITVGERTPHDARIDLVAYDDRWPDHFDVLAGRIRKALGDSIVLLEHVGSTSVPRLSAKPVIDIVLTVADSSNESVYVPALEAQGFVLRIRERDWFEHRLFKGVDIVSNLHVFSAGCEETRRMLIFRDWLRDHDDDRRRYEGRKRELAAHRWRHVEDYADAKSEIVEEIVGRAVRAARSELGDSEHAEAEGTTS